MNPNFRALLKEVAQITFELESYDKPRKLSASAFLRDAMSNANITLARLKELKQSLKAKPSLYPQCHAFHRKSVIWLKEKTCTRPPCDIKRLAWIANNFPELQAELASLRSSIFELFALSVQEAIERYPDAFGDVENYHEYESKGRELRQKRDELYKRVTAEFTPLDMNIGTPKPDGTAYISFAISNSEVCLAPLDNAGERLANWLRCHPEIVKTL